MEGEQAVAARILIEAWVSCAASGLLGAPFGGNGGEVVASTVAGRS